MSRQLNAKQIRKFSLAGIIFSIVLLIIVIGLFIMQNNINTSSSEIVSSNPELARAMNYEQLTEEDAKTQSENVEFSSFFTRDLNGDGYAEKVKGTCKEVGTQDTLYMSLNVLEDGVLKNGKIEIQANNIYFQTALIDDETIKGNYISANTQEINLKDVSVGTQKLIFGTVRSGNYSNDSTKMSAIGNDVNKYSGINKVILTGTHVASDGTETKIRKEIDLQVDWYNTPHAEIPYTYAGNQKNRNQSYNNTNIINTENNTLDLSFKLVEQETGNLARLSKVYIEGEIPELNGYAPTDVEITGENVTYTYDKETRKYTAQREAVLDDNGNIIKTANSGSYEKYRYNEFNVKVSYPLEAYETLGINTLTLNIPIRGYYEGYNNPNEEFDNPVRSNVAEDIIGIVYQNGSGDVIGYDVKVGQYVPNPYDAWVVSKDKATKEYNNEPDEKEDTYEVMWSVARGNDGTITSVKLNETSTNYSDKFLTTDNKYISMEDIVTNKGIYFYGAANMFGRDGYINVYNDETGELLHQFTANDWGVYTKDNPYLYPEGVKHIRIETSTAVANTYFAVYNIKKIDTKRLTEIYSKEEFDKFTLIYSYLTGYAKTNTQTEYTALINDQDRANYDPIQSIAEISNITPDGYSTQETQKNAKITIKTRKLAYNTSGWRNGQFILKFPKEILNIEVNNITTNNENIEIAGYSLEEADDGYSLRIITENENPEVFEIYVDLNITPDPRILTVNKNVELYSYNEECPNYESNGEDIYDLNGNGDTEDLVGKNNKNIQLVGPTSLITSETATNYNETADTVTGPQVAILEKSNTEKTANVTINLLNNYSGNISGIKLIGKIPFKGNKFQYTGNDVGSVYTTELTGPIAIPDTIKDYAKVYYSEQEQVTDDIYDENNGWKVADETTDFSKVKTYLIDFGSYLMQKGEQENCTYTIKLPENLNYNDVSYATHAVSFYLETEEGKLKAQTETNKLGFMIAKKYNLHLNKVKAGTNIALSGAMYQLTDVLTEETKILSTNEVGELTFKDLYAERTYKLKEVKAPTNYEKEEQEIVFYANATDDGSIDVQVIDGNVKEQNLEINAGITEAFTLEDEPNYNLELTKYEEGTNAIIPNVQYTLTKEGSEYSRTVTTDDNGKISLTSLNLNTVYELTEIKAKGYYLPIKSIKFKLVRNDNNYNLEILQGDATLEKIVANSDTINIPNVSISTTNEKAKLYSLEIIKYAKGTDKALQDASFRITGPGIEDGETYKTDDDGTINISNLYEYVDGKNTDGIYTITEIGSPKGYVLNNQEIKIKVTRNADNNLEVQVISGEIKETSVDQNTNKVTIKLENEPLFKLIKIDGETSEALPNTKFAIREVIDENTDTEALDAEGNPVGTLENINGVDYRVITTNADGEINLALKEGIYKVIEVQALEGYQLPEDISERTYYFGVGKSSEEVRKLVINTDTCILGTGSMYMSKVLPQADGGYLVGGYISSSLYIPAEDTVNGEAIHIIADKETYLIYSDPILVKFNNAGKVEWVIKLNGNAMDRTDDLLKISEDEFLWSITTTNQPGEDIYVSIPGEYMQDGNETSIEGNSAYLSTFITINSEGIIEKVDYINGISFIDYYFEEDGGILCSGVIFTDSLTIPGEKTADGKDIVINDKGSADALYIKLNKDKKIEWVKQIGGDKNDYIYYLCQGNDNKMFVYGYMYSTNIIINKEDTVNNEDITLTRKRKQ